MFAFHPCDRCQYSVPDNIFCKKGFNQFVTNGKYLAVNSKIVPVSDLCFKFKYIKEPVKTFEELFQKSHPVQLSLF